MDERKIILRDLEVKKTSDTEARNRLLEGLGEALISRIGEEAPFKDTTGETPGAALEEYRLFQKELDESFEMIKTLESETLKLRDMEAIISEKEKELSRSEKEQEEILVMLGRQLLPDPEFKEIAGSSKQQEEDLLAKIEELEKKLENLEDQKGGFLTWLGKNAQMAVSKNLLQRNRSSLQLLYRSVGEKYLSLDTEKTPNDNTGETVKRTLKLKEHLNSLAADIAEQKDGRKKTADLFGADGSPTRRITSIEKRIANVKGKLPGVYLRFGSLAAGSTGKKSDWAEELKALLTDDDSNVLCKAEDLNSKISERELAIKKINAAIDIDKKKAEIEKLSKAIDTQKQKIKFAGEAITGYENQIAQSEQAIEELEMFIRQN